MQRKASEKGKFQFWNDNKKNKKTDEWKEWEKELEKTKNCRSHLKEVSSGFNSPCDVAFHPTPGYHSGNYSEERMFYPEQGEEAWVVNGGNHNISIVASLGTEHQITISRRDRRYYHYMINDTAIAFNSQKELGRKAYQQTIFLRPSLDVISIKNHKI